MQPEFESTNGIFRYSLCDRCNNKTGYRYSNDYATRAGLIRPHAIDTNANETVSIDVSKIHPLRIIKQATLMMLSTSTPTDFAHHQFVSAPNRDRRDLAGIDINYPTKNWLVKAFQDLRLFVRQRDNTTFPHGVRVYLFVGVGRRIGFSTGIFSQVDLDARSVFFGAATGLYPLHWIFAFDSQPHREMLDVTEWSSYGYKERFRADIEVPIRWLVGHYPTDFRSPQDLTTFHFIHSMEFEGFVPSTSDDRDILLGEALFFARTLAKRTDKGHLISRFSTGTFYESGSVNGWLPNGNAEDARQVLESRLNQLESRRKRM